MYIIYIFDIIYTLMETFLLPFFNYAKLSSRKVPDRPKARVFKFLPFLLGCEDYPPERYPIVPRPVSSNFLLSCLGCEDYPTQ